VKYKIPVLLILLTIPRGLIFSQVTNQPDYKVIFGKQYTEALNYLNKNQWITTTLLRNKIDPCFAKSIVFPELIRYSYIRDRMEVEALKTLYVQYGQQYANFSVGRFQIKPGFAEKLEADLKVNPGFIGDTLVKNIDTAQTPYARLERIKRLDNEKWQVQYLVWFIKIMEVRFKNIVWKSEEEKLRFFATAYNCGYHYTKSYIEANMVKNYFHTALFNSAKKYNYASVSLYYWLNCRPGKAAP